MNSRTQHVDGNLRSAIKGANRIRRATERVPLPLEAIARRYYLPGIVGSHIERQWQREP